MKRQSINQRVDILIIGGGPAGLLAASELSNYDCKICVVESMPTLGRKFLMAGKSGLNITTSKTNFLNDYGESKEWIAPLIKNYGPSEIIEFCESLGQGVFFGSSNKVFPISMKTSPLLRAWVARLRRSGVDIQTSMKWIDFNNNINSHPKIGRLSHVVKSGDKDYCIISNATVLALGGASWPRLGSDGKWFNILQKYLGNSKKMLVPFSSANMGLKINWSRQMLKFEGLPVKSIALKVNGEFKKGEFIVSKSGVEGGLIYFLSTMQLEKVTSFEVDLLPNFSITAVYKKLCQPRGKSTMTNFLRKSLGVTGVKFGLLREFGYPFPKTPLELAKIIKNLEVKIDGYYSMDYAISTRGGVSKEAVNAELMLYNLPGVFCAGEMLDWTAPTGGGLLTGCFSTGSHVGKSIAKYLNLKLLN
ncbi:MAG: TIGR03862 family flavoprotein [Paracoccaceae bacterium]|nr:TIGR03862 family flavoprotein [Paracoccaceae bacterium]